MNEQKSCDRCGKRITDIEWDIHTCTPKQGLCDQCETVAHCLKYGCIPKQPAHECWLCGDMDPAFQAKCNVPACGMKERPAQRKPWAEMMRGVRVEGDTVVISVKGGNENARLLCGELLREKNA